MKRVRVDTREVEAAIKSGNEEGLPPGGVVKIRKTKKSPDLRPRKNKTPRQRKVSEGDTNASVEAQILAIDSPEEGVCKMNVVATATSAPTPANIRPEFEICPACGFFSKLSNKTTEKGEKIRFLVCKGCNDKYNLYAKQIADKMEPGKKLLVLSKVEWVLSQLDIPRFERELEEARKARLNPNPRIDERVRATASGQVLPKEVFIALRARIQKEVSNEDYFLVRRLFARLEAVKKLRPELEKMLAEKTADEPAEESATAQA